jgi:PPOX class probable F420-dependent enzyme
MQLTSMRRRVEHARVGRLATLSPGGTPHIVPVCFAFAGDTIGIAVDHKPKATTTLRRVENVRERGVASLLVDEYDEDWSHLWWVRVDAAARVVDEGSEAAAVIDALEAKYRGQYGLRPPSTPVVVLDPTRWVGWSASE